MIMLQWGSVGLSNLLSQLEALGFFQYGLPFLLIFAVSYAILKQLHVFEENTGAALIIALAVGLLSLQFDYVAAFFQNIFPKFGIGLAVLLVALILAGAFLPMDDKKEKYKWIFFGLGAIIFIVILATSFSDWQFSGNWWWQQYGAVIVVTIVIVAAIVGVVLTSKKSGE